MALITKKDLYLEILKRSKGRLTEEKFPVKRGMYYNIKAYVEGRTEFESKLYHEETLKGICSRLGIAKSLRKETVYFIEKP